MRLIDVDALPKAMEYDYETGEMKILYYDAWVIAHAPTVDAIPIKDLKKMKKLADKHWYRYCATSWDFGELIDEIIELWRKENESNISD